MAKNVAIILLIVVEIKKMNTASGMHNIASSANEPPDLHSSAFNGNEYLPNLLRHHQMPKTESLFKGIPRTMPMNLSMGRNQLIPWSGKKVSRLLRYLLNKRPSTNAILVQCGAIS